ncbi:hypothetical protein EG831_12045, partial [bacterium]|nr:hypothetical protein [bacterium]
MTNVSSVLLNGTNNITSQMNLSSQGGVTTGTYTQTNRFPSSSTQNLTITVNTSLGQSITFSNMVLSVPNYFVMPASYRLDPAAVSTPGFKVDVYETTAANPNTVLWTEEQLLGLHGPNLADTNVAQSWAGVIDFDNGQSAGNFANNTPFSELGLGVNPEKANTDNITAEFTTYVNFPTAGEYEMVVNSDDGFLVSTARNPQDRLGDRIFEVSFGRGISTGVDAGPIQRIIVDQPGVYPLRLLFENGGGGAGVEWYTRQGTNLTLINDTAPEALKAFQNATSSAAYVSRTSPIRGSTGVSPLSPISVTINDGDRRVNESTVAMTVNGAASQPTVTRAGT